MNAPIVFVLISIKYTELLRNGLFFVTVADFHPFISPFNSSENVSVYSYSLILFWLCF